MVSTEVENNTIVSLPTEFKAKHYWALMKPRLSFLVTFSAAFGYLLAFEGAINWVAFIALILGGFMVSGASVIINQVIEKDLDKIMNRTSKRPLPSEALNPQEATFFGVVIGLSGLMLLMVFTNALTALLSLASIVLYGFIYTPLKRVGPIAVIVGAIPGALPPMLGWVAATGQLSFEAFIVFTIQFVWQFPHFWAIAWVMDDDYKKAGFRLLPSKKGRSFNTALQIMLGTLFLIPVSCIPYQLGMTGFVSMVLAIIAALIFSVPAVKLMIAPTRQNALQIMFASFIYLPVIQIAFLLDKI